MRVFLKSRTWGKLRAACETCLRAMGVVYVDGPRPPSGIFISRFPFHCSPFHLMRSIPLSASSLARLLARNRWCIFSLFFFFLVRLLRNFHSFSGPASTKRCPRSNESPSNFSMNYSKDFQRSGPPDLAGACNVSTPLPDDEPRSGRMRSKRDCREEEEALVWGGREEGVGRQRG